jgi:hypothetical protein
MIKRCLFSKRLYELQRQSLHLRLVYRCFFPEYPSLVMITLYMMGIVFGIFIPLGFSDRRVLRRLLPALLQKKRL